MEQQKRSTILFNKQSLGEIPQADLTDFTALLPYWGLLFNEQTLEIQSGIPDKKMYMPQLGNWERDELQKWLAHTSLTISTNPHGADLTIDIYQDPIPRENPVSLIINKIKYRLKPRTTPSADLQKLIHKNIWLPFKSNHYTLYFHTEDRNSQLEILTYVAIQHFLGGYFKELSHIAPEQYTAWHKQFLQPINPSFAAHLKCGYLNQQDWPELPPELSMKQLNKPHPLISDESESKERVQSTATNRTGDTENSTRPKTSITDEGATFNPFKYQSKSASKSEAINPFKKQSQSKEKQNPFDPFKSRKN